MIDSKMTFVNPRLQHPKALHFARKTKQIQFPVKGQGVFVFKHDDHSVPCTFHLCDSQQNALLNIEFSKTSIQVTKVSDGVPLIDPTNTSGLDTTAGAYYWFSLDAQNFVLRAGIGEARSETAQYTYTFPTSSDTKQWLEHIVGIDVTNDVTEPLCLLRDPITAQVALHVKPMEKLTMHDIAKGDYMPVANLSATAQKLYNCIGGKQFILNDKDFHEFSQAIEYSIRTPGCWCFETLKSKSTDFSDKPNPNETYLRITLNKNNGESPGIPYVMEIWPSGHYSPIHNHGGADAVIRVLEGNIHVKLFSFLGGPTFGTKQFKKDDITWISPTLNQIHQLENPSSNKTACITIQCYMYESDDTRHYNYFDYIDSKGVIEQFDPNSDMDFLEFKKTMHEEWNQKLKQSSILLRLKYRLRRIFRI